MSKPVTRTDDGRKCVRSSVFLGQPREEKGTKAELNQVSRTSSSRRSEPLYPVARALAIASASDLATMTLPSSRYQAGI